LKPQNLETKKGSSFKEVAKLANISPATISRPLGVKLTFILAIRARVRKAAEKLGIDLERRRNEKSNIVGFLFGSEAYCASQDRELLFMSFRYSPTVPAKKLQLPRILNKMALSRAMI